MTAVPPDPNLPEGSPRQLPEPKFREPKFREPEAALQLRLAEALRRARWAIVWERLWPHLARILGVAGLFLAVSWSGFWLVVPMPVRIGALILFALLILASLFPLLWLRWPSREEALGRLDRGSGLRHRPATALTDTLTSQDPVARALWQTQRERTLASVRRIRAGLPAPRLAVHDPWALRSVIVLAVLATFVAAGGERRQRLAAAFDWGGIIAPSNIRVDAWVSPPAYTGRPPIILASANRDNAPTADTVAVPAGSTLIVRASGGTLDVVTGGGLTEAALAEPPPAGASERHFTITTNGTAHVRAPESQPQWTFNAAADQPPSIALVGTPARQARGALQMSYKIEDDFGVTGAHAKFALRPSPTPKDPEREADASPRPLFEPPQFALTLPNARTRNGVGQTVKDLTEDPYAGADMTLTLTARDEAGNEGHSEPFNMRLPERLFTKPLARALIEQRRLLALDANKADEVHTALDALMIAPEVFTPEQGQYLGLYTVRHELEQAGQLEGDKADAALREVVASLWALAVSIEDGNITDVDKALRAAQDALREALERGASDEEIRKLTENLRAALDKFMQQLAEQMRNNPQQLARPLDRNTKILRQQDLNNMLDRMERLSRSGDKDAARQMLDQLAQMLENLQMAQPGQTGDSDMEQSLNELGDMIRKQQQLRDRTFKQGQDSRRDRLHGKQGDSRMGDLQQDQQALRDRLHKLQQELAKRGFGPQQGQKGQKGQRGQQGDQGQQGESGSQPGESDGDALGDADSAMGDANGRLGQGNTDGAVDSQGRALEALRKGAQNLAQAMQQGEGEGQGEDGPGNRPGRQQSGGNQTDPLGRPLHGREFGDDFTVRIPGEIDAQRARRILEELRRRLADPNRPQLELDYIERLLKDF